jgi:Ca-activated chloride channel family protein
VPAGVPIPAADTDPLKYQSATALTANAATDEVLTVKLRYKAPDADHSRLIARTVQNRLQPASPNLGFAAAVSEVGMLLRGSKHAPQASFTGAIARARKFRGPDPDGYRAEFLSLAEVAATLTKLR